MSAQPSPYVRVSFLAKSRWRSKTRFFVSSVIIGYSHMIHTAVQMELDLMYYYVHSMTIVKNFGSKPFLWSSASFILSRPIHPSLSFDTFRLTSLFLGVFFLSVSPLSTRPNPNLKLPKHANLTYLFEPLSLTLARTG